MKYTVKNFGVKKINPTVYFKSIDKNVLIFTIYGVNVNIVKIICPVSDSIDREKSFKIYDKDTDTMKEDHKIDCEINFVPESPEETSLLNRFEVYEHHYKQLEYILISASHFNGKNPMEIVEEVKLK